MPQRTEGMYVLPQQEGLDIAAFSRTLAKKTTSYKFLWLLALLDCLPLSDGKPKQIARQKLTLRMLRLADAPIRRYRLSFGMWDKTKERFLSFAKQEKEFGISIFEKFKNDDDIMRVAKKECKDVESYFKRFVPRQWLTPFFARENLPQDSDSRGRKIANELAPSRFFEDSPLPYRFVKVGREMFLEMHPLWISYFVRNQEIIRGWVMYHWIDYLQARNPNTPAIVAKIADPKERLQLNNERKWWKRVMGIIGETRCIYSGAKIIGGDFELDHFLPWSFVGHNRLWNLIPVAKEANASKGDNLPNLEKYLPSFVAAQQRALTVYSKNPSRFPGQLEIVDAYISDLGISISPPPGFDALSQAYRNDMLPLADLARNRGFACDWQYRRQ